MMADARENKMRGAGLLLAAAFILGPAIQTKAQSDTPASGLRLPPAIPGAGAAAPAPQPFRTPPAPSAPVQAEKPLPPQPDAPRNLNSFADPAQRAAAAFQTTGYKITGLMAAVYEGRTKDVPDDQKTRTLVFSLLKAFADVCGPPAQNVTMAATTYVSSDARRANRGDGLTVLAERLKDLAAARDRGLASGDIAGSVLSLQEKRAVLAQEGLDDGQVFLSRHDCGSEVYSRFSANLHAIIFAHSRDEPASYDELRFWGLMSPEYRQQNNIPDPAAELAKRKTAELKKGAEKNCAQKFERSGFCSCAIGKLEAVSMTDADWTALSGNFRMVAALGKDRDSILGAVRSCY